MMSAPSIIRHNDVHHRPSLTDRDRLPVDIAEIVHREIDSLFQIGLSDEVAVGPFPSAALSRLRPPQQDHALLPENQNAVRSVPI
ncbi:hypothetical protein ACFPFP_00060 [Bradyrhizobium sp. GCM10023182]|uniref:Uncharacterized protein n=1 Tax=Bradyrhizobium zhengyangense TaxID=2911009 RepID=A0ABS9LE96_9BRAD|nr:hypothetical protein [Bradyrhizobium zhengyangense]MCG2665320.1 hypothetical protein [Bradyrhizobium zhengyangense]